MATTTIEKIKGMDEKALDAEILEFDEGDKLLEMINRLILSVLYMGSDELNAEDARKLESFFDMNKFEEACRVFGSN